MENCNGETTTKMNILKFDNNDDSNDGSSNLIYRDHMQ